MDDFDIFEDQQENEKRKNNMDDSMFDLRSISENSSYWRQPSDNKDIFSGDVPGNRESSVFNSFH
jgi:hypothetical protein